jgi:hypothetical protein
MHKSDLENASELGILRLENASMIDAAVMIPKPPAWTNRRKAMIRKQRKAHGNDDKLLDNYMELLVRSVALTDFIRHNVGQTDDWPICVFGDSAQAEDYLSNLVNRLQSVVGCLVEV